VRRTGANPREKCWCQEPVHHPDRGSQYASRDYIELLKANQIRVSMSRRGNPWDNAACESLTTTLKHEEVNHNEYRDLVESRASIAQRPRPGGKY